MKMSNRPSKDELYRLYIEEQKSAPEISSILNVPKPTIVNWLRHYDIKLRTRSEARLIGKRLPTKEELYRLYIEEQKSPRKISSIIGVSPNTITKWLRGYDIPLRTRREALLANTKRPDEEELYRLYVEEQKSVREISDILKVSQDSVKRWILGYDIQPRTLREAVLVNTKRPEKEELVSLYIEEQKTPSEIAGIFNVSEESVRNWLRGYDVPLRTRSEAKLCNTKRPEKEELVRLYKEAGQSSTEIANDLGVWPTTVITWLEDYNIPRDNTYTIGTSSHEEELSEFLMEHGIEHTTNARSISSPYELDIYIPEYKIAIELNGCYWHSEARGKDQNYHLDKTELCQEKGIQLIHIWDLEWENKKEIVKSMLLNKFGKTERKIYARKCEIREVHAPQANKFLNECHIQGKARSTVKLALIHGDEMVALLTMLRQKDGTWYMSRYCNALNTTVVGGFSKLLKAFRKEHPEEIITHANLRFGTGNVYVVNGFEFIKQTKPTPWWFKSGELHHHTQYRKYKQHKLLEHFDPALSEIENMHRHGFVRVWDCGHMKFRLT